MDLMMRIPLLLPLLLVNLCNADYGVAPNNVEILDISDREDMTTTILRMNNGSGQFLFEGDIVAPTVRTAMKCLRVPDSCLWPRRGRTYVEIPYTLSEKYDADEKSEILRAMRDLESVTCIRYVVRTSQTAYISIEPRYGCSSLPGYMGDKQVLSLQKFGCVTFGIIQHELLHALGFYHEHTRSDRDQHIAINWDNIKEYYRYNFQKKDTNNLGTPYDYTSVMHYGRTAFGKMDSETITPIPNANAPIGQRERVSNIDIIRINRLYKCTNNSG